MKLDDAGLYLSTKANAAVRALGRGIVRGSPYLMKFLSVAGTAAMFMVGGSILVHGVPPVHHGVEAAAAASGLVGLTQVLLEALIGVLAGAVIVAAFAVGTRLFRRKPGAAGADTR